MKLTAILASAVLIEAQVSNLRSKMTINFTPGCLVLQKKKKRKLYTAVWSLYSIFGDLFILKLSERQTRKDYSNHLLVL